MNAANDSVLEAIRNGASNVKLLARVMRKMGVKDAAMWDSIADLRKNGLLTYDACSGALEVKA
jgi:hypothetical protein